MLNRPLSAPGFPSEVAEAMKASMAAAAPMGRLATAADIAAGVLALVQLDWVTGITLPCDGGLSQVSPISVPRRVGA
jgi:NAD(P)-dependent dehydrogenase (short-subunit alcohol dehydrogenase family)